MLKKIWTPMLVEEHILARVGKEPLNSYYYATHYPRVYAAASEKISLSRMTFSHQMVRLIFVEQIYRAQTILHHEPYHHE